MLIVTPDNLDVWPDEVPNGAEITLVVTGAVAKGVKDSDQLVLVADQAVAAPRGACVEYTWTEATGCPDGSTTCTTEQLTELTPETRLGVLGENNCVTHHVTLEQIMAYVNENAEPPKLCDLIDLDLEQPTAGIKLLGVNDSCEVVSIPAASLDCSMTDPEPFGCG